MVKPSEMPRPLALTGLTIHLKHFTSNDKTKRKMYKMSPASVAASLAFVYVVRKQSRPKMVPTDASLNRPGND